MNVLFAALALYNSGIGIMWGHGMPLTNGSDLEAIHHQSSAAKHHISRSMQHPISLFGNLEALRPSRLDGLTGMIYSTSSHIANS